MQITFSSTLKWAAALSFEYISILKRKIIHGNSYPTQTFSAPDIFKEFSLWALTISQNWLAGPVVLNMKWAFFSQDFPTNLPNLPNIYLFDWTKLTNNGILFSNIPVMPASSDKW